MFVAISSWLTDVTLELTIKFSKTLNDKYYTNDSSNPNNITITTMSQMKH